MQNYSFFIGYANKSKEICLEFVRYVPTLPFIIKGENIRGAKSFPPEAPIGVVDLMRQPQKR